MSYGEFRKRIIKELAESPFEMKGTPTRILSVEINDINNRLNAILAEAKAEFPKYPEVPVDGKGWLDLLDNYDHNVEEWFKKWFGGSE